MAYSGVNLGMAVVLDLQNSPTSVKTISFDLNDLPIFIRGSPGKKLEFSINRVLENEDEKKANHELLKKKIVELLTICNSISFLPLPCYVFNIVLNDHVNEEEDSMVHAASLPAVF